MAKRAGVVSIDVEPNLSQVGSKIQAEAARLKPVGLKFQVDGDVAKTLGSQVAIGQRSLDSITTTRAQNEIKALGSTADRELSRIGMKAQATSDKLAPAPFGGGALVPTGFAVSNSTTTPTARPVAPPTRAGSTIEFASFTAAEPAIRRVGSTISDVESKATIGTRSVSRLGSTFRTAAQGAGELGNTVAPLTGDLGGLVSVLGSAASGGLAATAALEVAVAGFSSAWSQLQNQTKEGVDLFSAVDPTKFKAAFDPEQPHRFFLEMEGIKRTLGQLDAIGPLNAGDKILGGDGSAKVAAEDVKRLKEALDSVSTAQARQAVDYLAPALQRYEAEGKIAKGTTKELYNQIGDRESIDRAAASVKDLTTQVDAYGHAIDRNKGKFGQLVDQTANLTAPFEAAASTARALSDANRAVARDEAEIDRIRKASIPGSEEAIAAAEKLADAEQGVGDALRSEASARRELANANRDLAALQAELAHIDPQRDPNRYRDLSEKVRDAQDAQLNAEDRVASAAEATQKATRDLRDTRADTKKATDELADAESKLAGDQAAAQQAAQDHAAAEAALADEFAKHPDLIAAAIASLDQLVAHGDLTRAEADAIAASWRKAAAEAQTYADTYNEIHTSEYVTPDGVDHEHQADRGKNTSQPPTAYEKIANKRELTPAEGRTIGLGDNENEIYASSVPDTHGRPWQYNYKKNRWVAKFHTGGLVNAPDGQEIDARLLGNEFVLNRRTVQRLGAGNLLALNAGADLPAVAARPTATVSAPAGSAVLDELRRQSSTLDSLRGVIENLQHVTYAPQFHGVTEADVGPTMDESFRSARRDAWTEHGRDLRRG
ncbi:MAG: hypothetical protein U0Q22_03630 [Acidimicrobiales bacterium]